MDFSFVSACGFALAAENQKRIVPAGEREAASGRFGKAPPMNTRATGIIKIDTSIFHLLPLAA
jgi:hypothetical protein